MVLLAVRYLSPLLTQHGQERQSSGEFCYQMYEKNKSKTVFVSNISAKLNTF